MLTEKFVTCIARRATPLELCLARSSLEAAVAAFEGKKMDPFERAALLLKAAQLSLPQGVPFEVKEGAGEGAAARYFRLAVKATAARTDLLQLACGGFWTSLAGRKQDDRATQVAKDDARKNVYTALLIFLSLGSFRFFFFFCFFLLIFFSVAFLSSGP